VTEKQKSIANLLLRDMQTWKRRRMWRVVKMNCILIIGLGFLALAVWITLTGGVR